MKIAFLGHSEYIVEIENNGGKTVRILFDAWLSDHAFGDFMAREPSVEAGIESLPPLDAIYLSHPHCDHFDPYTLVRIFRTGRPALFLPETAAFLAPLLEQYLDNPEIIPLHHAEEVRWNGLTVSALSFHSGYHTNEEDVMMPVLFSNKEIFFSEVDAALPDDPEACTLLHTLFKRFQFQNRVYMATRNELEALFLSIDAKTSQERRTALRDYRARRTLECALEYEKYDSEGFDAPEIWKLNHLIKLFSGQGMIFAPEICPDYLPVSTPFSLKEVLEMEKKTAKRYNRKLGLAIHEPGKIVSIENGRIVKTEPIRWLSARSHSPSFSAPDRIIQKRERIAPLFDEKRDADRQAEKIEQILHERYRFFLTGDLEEPFQSLLRNKRNGMYVVEIRYGDSKEFRSTYYAIGYATVSMEKHANAPDDVDEIYWANDLEDFIDGRQDQFSTTLHTFFPEKSIRLWTMLGIPFLNSDIVYRKLEFHFQRALAGKSASEWVLESATHLKPYYSVQNTKKGG